MGVFTEYWARCLDGREYPIGITDEERERMKADGIVAFYGQSDDLLEAVGAINEEWGAWGGKTLRFERGIVSAVWTSSGTLPPWVVLASVRGDTFSIIEGGGAQSRGIVVVAKDLGKLLEVEE